MSKYTIHPWRTQKDLLDLRADLYNTTTTQKRKKTAVAQIMSWKQRRTNLPHALESTALLTDAQLHHHTTASPFSIRAVYSAAFTRFVTGFCDIGRQQREQQSSMLDVARQIGMPGEFVALRHEATHEEMPGMRRLVEATGRALEWLWGVYWAKLEEEEEVDAGFGVEVLREFRRGRRDFLRKGGDDVTARTTERCLGLCAGSARRTEALAETMVNERLIFPSNRDFGSPMQGAYLLWDPLLQNLRTHLPHFPTLLTRTLLTTLTTPTPTDAEEKEALALWILHLADGQEQQVMRWCCLHPGSWTRFLGREVLRAGGAAAAAEWEELFVASAAGGEGRVSEKVVVQEREGGDVDVGWRRAIVSPKTAIGVV